MAGKRARTRYTTLCVLVCLWILGAAVSATPAEVYEGLDINWPRERLPAPDFELESLTASSLRLSDYQGKLVLLNFWATFCAPCRKEMPALQALYKEYSDEGFVVLAVAVDRGGRETVAPYISGGGYSFPVALDPDGSVRNRYEVRAFPTTYLIGRDGRFVARLTGDRAWDSHEFRVLIQTLLGTSETQ